jgi:hypothetical protein
VEVCDIEYTAKHTVDRTAAAEPYCCIQASRPSDDAVETRIRIQSTVERTEEAIG